MRSESCQSGPVSRSTTFLPAVASTAAHPKPEALDGTHSSSVEIGKGRADVEDARLQQSFFRKNGDLRIDEVSDTRCARAGNQSLAQCLEGLDLVGLEQAERCALGARCARSQQNLDAADRERERSDCRAAHELPSLAHVHLPAGATIFGRRPPTVKV